MAISRGVPWTDEDEKTLERVYPDGGWEAAVAAMPYRSAASIKQRASLRDLRLKRHRGGIKKGTSRSRPEAPYTPTTQAERQLQEQNARLGLALREWGFIDRKGQLKPSVGMTLPVLGMREAA